MVRRNIDVASDLGVSHDVVGGPHCGDFSLRFNKRWTSFVKAAFKITISFSALALLGVVLFCAVDSFLLGRIDPKLDPDRISAFQTGVGFGILLIKGSIVPVFLVAAAAPHFVARSSSLFVLVTSAVTLLLFITKAFLPIADWLEPFMPRSLLYPLIVASVLGACGALAGVLSMLLLKKHAHA